MAVTNDIKVDLNKKSPLLDEEDLDSIDENSEGISDIKVNTNILREAEKETNLNIPSEYIPIKLVSNGRIKGIPSILHFRDYSVAESLDINTYSLEDKPKVIADVLTKMCYEHFDISDLPIQDVLYILYIIHATFISNTVSKTIYLDESLPEGTDKGQLDNEDNLEIVDIPITSLHFTYLGKDKDDKNLKTNIHIPFKIKDTKTNSEVEFKISTLKDSILAQNYCRNLFNDDLIKFSSIRKMVDEIQSIKDKDEKNKAMDRYLETNYDECNEYYKFKKRYSIMDAQLIQAQQLVSYNGEKLETLDKKWEIYSTEISSGLWSKYLSVVDSIIFGISNDVEVYSNKLQKKLKRNIGFQLSDFLSVDRPKDSDRYDVLFD